MGESYYFMPQILTKLDTESIKRNSKKRIIRSYNFKIAPNNMAHPNDILRKFINSVFLRDFEKPESQQVRCSKKENSFVFINHSYDSAFQKFAHLK